MASGEMSPTAFRAFLDRFIRCAINVSRDGAIHYIFMDWRHLHELLGTALPLYSEWKAALKRVIATKQARDSHRIGSKEFRAANAEYVAALAAYDAVARKV